MEPVTVVLLVLGAGVLVVALWAVATYNGLVRLRNLVQEAWRQIDVELHRRHDLVPGLVEAVGGAGTALAGNVLEEVTRARAAAAAPGSAPAQQAEHENELTAALGRMLATADTDPRLRTDERVVALQAELTNTEDRMAAGRRFYNANVRQLNTKIESFPRSVLAGLLGFRPAEYFEANDPAVRAAPAVTFTDPDADADDAADDGPRHDGGAPAAGPDGAAGTIPGR